MFKKYIATNVPLSETQALGRAGVISQTDGDCLDLDTAEIPKGFTHLYLVTPRDHKGFGVFENQSYFFKVA